MREEAHRWIEQARAERDAAHTSLRSGIHYLAAFLAHQAVEKLLKGLTIERTRALAPHTHDLLRLGGGLGVPDDVRGALRRLNPQYSVARYPDAANGIPAQQYDETIAAPLLAAMEEVFQWATSA